MLTSSHSQAAAASALHLHKLTLWNLDQRRNWRRYAPVHYRLFNSFRTKRAYTFEDVTTRGNYYPDKRMATAAVSGLDSQINGHALISSRTRRFTSTLPASRRKVWRQLSRKLKR